MEITAHKHGSQTHYSSCFIFFPAVFNQLWSPFERLAWVESKRVAGGFKRIVSEDRSPQLHSRSVGLCCAAKFLIVSIFLTHLTNHLEFPVLMINFQLFNLSKELLTMFFDGGWKRDNKSKCNPGKIVILLWGKWMIPDVVLCQNLNIFLSTG